MIPIKNSCFRGLPTASCMRILIGGLLFLLSQPGISGEGVEVLSFSPQNTVEKIRQVRVLFSDTMVDFGERERKGDVPFDIDCGRKAWPGRGHWEDTKNWIYDFEQDLPAGVQCSFKMKENLKALSGVTVRREKAEFIFDTGGPSIQYVEPSANGWWPIDEEQIFILTVNGEVNQKTVLQHAYFSVEGILEKIPAVWVDHDPSKERPFLSGIFGSEKNSKKKDLIKKVFLRAQRRFPPESKVTLVWGTGISTIGGAATKSDQSFEFKVRSDFKTHFSCEKENAESGCIPISPIVLHFSADISGKEAKKIRIRGPGGKEWKPEENPYESNSTGEEGQSSVRFKGIFPEKSRLEIVIPSGLKDDAGRSLVNFSEFPLPVETAEFPSLLKFSSSFGVIEWSPEAALPVTVRNVESDLKMRRGGFSQDLKSSSNIHGKFYRLEKGNISQLTDWLVRIGRSNREKSLFASSTFKTEVLQIHKPNTEKEFEVVGIPFKNPGFYILEFESKRLGDSLLGGKGPMYVSTAALVTNLSVHLKKGVESSLVWVTTLDQARPVSGAAVAVLNCKGDVLAQGKTNEKGVLLIPRVLPKEANCSKKMGYSEYGSGFTAVAEKAGDFAFVHSSWKKGIEPWRYNLPAVDVVTPELASTVFDRTLFRAGETVHMKHFFRKHSSRNIQFVSPSQLPQAVRIQYQENTESYEFPLKWRAGGVAESTWSIPKTAKLGNYTVALLKNRTVQSKSKKSDRGMSVQNQSWPSGNFRVEEYRVPQMRAQIKPPAHTLVAPNSVPFDVSVSYFSGGTAAHLPVQVRHQTSTVHSTEFRDFEGFAFGVGMFKLPSQEATSYEGDEEDSESYRSGGSLSKARKQAVQLDASGSGQVVVELSDQNSDQLRNLQFEVDFKDPNGETQTASSTVKIFSSERLVGIKTLGWGGTQESLKFQVAVVDLQGRPVAHAPVTVQFLERKTYSHRKRLVGGFYAYESNSELKRRGKACEGDTDDHGFLECDTKPPVTGNIVLEAQTKDEASRPSYSNISTWVYGNAQGWFAQEDSDRIDLLPDLAGSKSYEIGEKAVFQVRMPFREATALVTVEREGILDSFVVPLSGKKPLIEIPIRSGYAPNVFVSALVVRGRVGDIQPTAMIDLGKPAYKLGLAEIRVGWKPHELKVQVEPSQEIFRVREKGRFKIQVLRSQDNVGSGQATSPLPKGAEVALAVVDEGLLQLKSNDSWNLLESMMRRRGYEVETSTIQSEVIGKRHFGLKAMPLGGDGGKAPTREIFDSLLYWNPKILLDSKGQAEIEFPMNDSISSYQVTAIAYAGADLFGTGSSVIRTNQDLMILSGIPPVAREGDHMKLDLTFRNTTAKTMTIEVAGRAKGIPDLKSSSIVLNPQEGKIVPWQVDIPVGVTQLEYEISARDNLSQAKDRILWKQKVVPSVPVQVVQSTLAQVEGVYQLPIGKPPEESIKNRGGLRVVLDSSILAGIEGVKEYMGNYPYSCLEQRVSRAIALRDSKQWKSLMEDLPHYLDARGLVKYFPSEWNLGSDILTSYVLAISNEAGWSIPEEIQKKMTQGLRNFLEGRIPENKELPAGDLTVRKISALEALSRYEECDWALTNTLELNPNLWPTSAAIDWLAALKRLKNVPSQADKLKELDQILRSRLDFRGTKMSFSTESKDYLGWMMASPDGNASRFFLAVSEDPLWKLDLGRVIRGCVGRQNQGHWGTTPANAWGVLALERFSSIFEKVPVSGETKVHWIDRSQIKKWNSQSGNSAIFDFPWGTAPDSLVATHSGTGNPWITVQSRAAISSKEPRWNGFRIEKKWSAVEQKKKGKWSRGDIARITLELEAQADSTWVVLNDPIPAGATILGSGLGNDSRIADKSRSAQASYSMEPQFQERAFDGYRAYYAYIPKGKWTAEYTVRLNQVGKMILPPSHLEAMYEPEISADLPSEAISVEE